MALKHYAITVYQHTNPSNSSDPANGFYVCLQPAAYINGTLVQQPGDPRLATAAEIAAVGGSGGQPFATLAAAQAVVTLAQAYFASQNASIVQPGVQAPAIDALVAGPVLV